MGELGELRTLDGRAEPIQAPASRAPGAWIPPCELVPLLAARQRPRAASGERGQATSVIGGAS